MQPPSNPTLSFRVEWRGLPLLVRSCEQVAPRSRGISLGFRASHARFDWTPHPVLECPQTKSHGIQLFSERRAPQQILQEARNEETNHAVHIVFGLATLPAFAQQHPGGGGAPRGGGTPAVAVKVSPPAGPAHVGGGHIPAHGPTRAPARPAAPANRGHEEAARPTFASARPSRSPAHSAKAIVGSAMKAATIPTTISIIRGSTGHFRGEIGRNHIYRIEGGGRDRFSVWRLLLWRRAL